MAAMAVDFCPFPVGLARFSLRFVFALLFSLSVAGSALCFPSRKDLFFESPISTLPELSNATMDSKRSSKYLEKITEATQLRYTFKMLDADFFNDTKVMETAEGALEFNLPIIKSNRRLVASENGGLHGPSCLVFNPEWTQKHVVDASKRFQHPALSGILRPKSDEDIAFMSILELGELIRTKQITSHELVQIFLERLKRYDPVLEAVITFTDELAYKQAREVDELIAKGVYLGILPIYYHHNLRTSVIFTVKMIFFEGFGNFEILLLTGPLHGIPYGLKDIIAVPGYKTTWGSRSFKDQVLNIEAWVYKRFQTYVKVFLLQSECTLITFFLFYANYRLRSAGAVLVAKLVSGSLAYDDIWFGGRTRNPWNIEEFSTGSSAGPAAGTSAVLATKNWLFKNRYGSVCNWFRNSWLNHIPCISLWCDGTASNFWCRWSNRCNEHIRKHGDILNDSFHEALQIVQSFLMLFGGRIQMISHQETLLLMIHFPSTLRSLRLDIWMMLKWRLFMCSRQKVLIWFLSN
ncbi:uncharacterized protein LOC110635178 isoform X2 [Hevea brasiliensis]|uniref:uncharacterized protein LOC110635178 isoform X2 n=1 Tax=Hevea brasiliensis TaxID=3981 RepID=UPI0025E6BEC9|nr:uncharacterized protein LOC110635178 isoform X2 [Hevea brasiliensis]